MKIVLLIVFAIIAVIGIGRSTELDRPENERNRAAIIGGIAAIIAFIILCGTIGVYIK